MLSAPTGSWLRLVVTLSILATAARAQGEPHIGYAFPAGGQVGTTVELQIGGQMLRGIDQALVSGDGVVAEVVTVDRLMSKKDFKVMRDEARELNKRKTTAQKQERAGKQAAWTEDEQARLTELRDKLRDYGHRETNPSIADEVKLRIHIAADAATGRRELRLGSPTGFSNPLVFYIADLPEVIEVDDVTELSLPAVFNGQIGPGDTDRIRFPAREGQRLLLAASARELIPYLPDAVPGWFQATLSLYDPDGDELAFVDDHRFDPDPVLCYEIPADGTYEAEIRDALYRGRDDFVYRITVGELPFVTGIFPLGGPIGSPTRVEVHGFNIAESSVELPASPEAGVSRIPLPGARDGVLFARDTLLEQRDQEPNDTTAEAQRVEVGLINGRIDHPGDVDLFRIDGRVGQTLVAEILARRLRSPLDATLRLTDENGTEIAFCDDREDRSAGLTTHHADPWLLAELPRTGSYYLQVSDAQAQGGEAYGYRLRVGPPRPDFELRVSPSALNARAGSTVPLTLWALRKDGFEGDIELSLDDAPRGFWLSGRRIPKGQDRLVMTLTVPQQPTEQPVALRLRATARIGRQQVSHDVVPADDRMQAFLNRHLVASTDFLVSVGPRGRGTPVLRPVRKGPLQLPAGGSTRILLSQPHRARRSAGPIHFELRDPPEGVTIESGEQAPNGYSLVITCTAERPAAELRGNLIVEVLSTIQPKSQDGRPRNPKTVSLGLVPAIPFEIVSR